MREMHPKLLERLLAITKDFANEYGPSEREIRLYYWFHVYLYNEILKVGGEYTGHVFRLKGSQTLLVVKAFFEGTLRVVFVTAQDEPNCIRIFFRKLYEQTLEWKRDKYS